MYNVHVHTVACTDCAYDYAIYIILYYMYAVNDIRWVTELMFVNLVACQ